MMQLFHHIWYINSLTISPKVFIGMQTAALIGFVATECRSAVYTFNTLDYKRRK